MADKLSGKGGAVWVANSTSSTITSVAALGDINSWELSITGDTVETTAFSKLSAETSAKANEPGVYGWEVTANGVMAKEAPYVSVNSKYRLLMRESNLGNSTTKNYLFYTGIGICTGNTEGMVVNGEATRNFTFQGTKEVSATYSASYNVVIGA